jgi:hypothetical protein
LENNVKMDPRDVEWVGMDRINLAEDGELGGIEWVGMDRLKLA